MEPQRRPDDRSVIDNIQVDTVPTPNPNALMFRVTEVLIPTGTHEYMKGSEAKNAPLAQVLLKHEGVELVLIAPRFVTVRKEPEASWAQIVPPLKDDLRRFLASGEMAVLDTGIGLKPEERTALERKIIQILDDDIRPALANDGGDVSFVSFEEGVVYLQLSGACGTCPSSTMTLKMGIEALLKEELPEVTSVEHVGT
jgi:Fe-S cluster biogenesis protein NfuA